MAQLLPKIGNPINLHPLLIYYYENDIKGE